MAGRESRNIANDFSRVAGNGAAADGNANIADVLDARGEGKHLYMVAIKSLPQEAGRFLSDF